MKVILIALAAAGLCACSEPAPEPAVPPTAEQEFAPTQTPDSNNLAPALESGGDENPANTATESTEPPATP